MPTYNMFNLATGYNGGVYDESYNWTTDPEYIEQGYNVQHLYDEQLDKALHGYGLRRRAQRRGDLP